MFMQYCPPELKIVITVDGQLGHPYLVFTTQGTYVKYTH